MRKFFKLKAILSVSLLGSSFSVMAVNAKPEPVEILQPDGTRLKVTLKGNHRFNYALSENGDVLVANKDGILEYGVLNAEGLLVPSGINALGPKSQIKGKVPELKELDKIFQGAQSNKKRKRTLSRSLTYDGTKYRYSDNMFPARGEIRIPVVLVEYQDVKFTIEDPKAFYEDFFNGKNFNRSGAMGSVKKYFSENSCGAFVLQFDIYGPITVSKNRGFYGAGYEENAYMMVTESVEQLDDEVNFALYNNVGTGYVDGIVIMYAGRGQANGGGAETVWPYSWELEYEDVDFWADGVKFNQYACINELVSATDPEGIGVLTHEFCHIMGLPDYYNTLYTDPSTPGDWALMATGSYNHNGKVPPSLSAFDRYCFGWIKPDEITLTGDYEIENLHDSNKAYILTTEEDPDEFFMLENRVRSRWDTYLPGEGMLVWKIRFNQETWDANEVNNRPSDQGIIIVRADNTADRPSQAGDTFPGKEGVTQFGFTTSPALKSFAGNPLNVRDISDIRLEDDKIKFHAKVNEERPPAGIESVIDSEIRLEGNILSSEKESVLAFDLLGRGVGVAAPGSPLTLCSGIYIVKGRKFIVR